MKLLRIVTIEAARVRPGDVILEGKKLIQRKVTRVDLSQVNSPRLLFRYECKITDMFHPRDSVQVGIFGNEDS